MPPYLGGFRIVRAAWLNRHSLQVRFASTWGENYYHQIYAGRSLVGVTNSPSDRVVIGAVKPSLWPQHLTLLAVSPTRKETNYGDALPRRPYNRARLRFTVSGYPSDAEFLDVTAGTVPGGAVSAGNRIARVLYDVDREYEVLSPPLAGSGTWNFAVQGVDDKPDTGNAGASAAIAAPGILAHPPDVPQTNSVRVSASIAGGIATLTYTRPA